MTTKKSKILPIKVWLDKDSCRTEKPQGEGYTEYIRKDAFIKKASKWLQEHSGDYLLYPFCEFDIGELVKEYKKAMKEWI